MSKRCQCVGKKMALLVLRRVGLCVGQNQMCHFVRLAFRVVFLSVYCCSVGRHRVATNEQGLALLGYLKNVSRQLKPNIF